MEPVGARATRHQHVHVHHDCGDRCPRAYLLAAEFIAPPVLSVVPWNIFWGGVLFAVYYFGMTHSYRGGDFTVAYPLARALPVLMVAGAEVALGDAPTPLGWVGILLIAAGSVVVPLQSLQELNITRYWNMTTVWILMAAVGIAGYTVVDRAGLRAAAERTDVCDTIWCIGSGGRRRGLFCDAARGARKNRNPANMGRLETARSSRPFLCLAVIHSFYGHFNPTTARVM